MGQGRVKGGSREGQGRVIERVGGGSGEGQRRVEECKKRTAEPWECLMLPMGLIQPTSLRLAMVLKAMITANGLAPKGITAGMRASACHMHLAVADCSRILLAT